MKFLEAPDDVKLKILEVSDPCDIRTCQLVCHKLHDLIVSSPQIQYILVLDTLGYTLPSVPRLDLTLHQKIEFLERHRRNWVFPGNCQPTSTEYVIQLSSAGALHQYNGGVYTHPLHFAPHSQNIVGLHFYQLPSPNLGLGFREWLIPDLGLLAQGFTIDTAQGLLVLVELTDPTRSWSAGCCIHLRTMSDNSQHPEAAAPFLMAEFTESEGDLGGRLQTMNFQIEVIGNVLAILFRSRTHHMTSWVIVWDWNRGVEVTRFSTGTRFNLGSFTLLSENTLLLPRCSKSYYAQKKVPEDTFGSLDIYTFDPHGNTSTPPRMVVSFDLPKLESTSCRSELQIERDQHPKVTSTHADPRPKVYDLPVRNRLVAVRVQLQSWPASLGGRSPLTGLIYVPTNVLLHPQAYTKCQDKMHGTTVNHEGVTKVPWGAWAHLSSWNQIGGLFSATSVHGQRAVEFPTWATDKRGEEIGKIHEMQLLDFDPRRMSRAKLDKKSEFENKESDIICLAATSTHDKSWRDSGADAFCEAQAKCVRRVWRVRSGSEQATYQRIITDDEHVIVQKHELSGPFSLVGKLSLQVYTL